MSHYESFAWTMLRRDQKRLIMIRAQITVIGYDWPYLGHSRCLESES